MRVHTGEKPISCPWPGCDQTFMNPSGLKTHSIRSHDKSIKYKHW